MAILPQFQSYLYLALSPSTSLPACNHFMHSYMLLLALGGTELKFTKVAKSKPCLGQITHVEACNLIFVPFSYLENMLICLSSYSYPATMPAVLIYNPVAKTMPSVTPASSNLLVCKIAKFLSCVFFVKLTSYKLEPHTWH